jgi:hypothetical protein
MQQLSHDMIEEVMQAAFKARVWSVLQWLVPLLCALPEARHMHLSKTVGCLQLAVAKPSWQVTDALCSCLHNGQAAQSGDTSAQHGLSSDEAERLLACALPTETAYELPPGASGSLRGFDRVCSLQCVRQAVDADAVVRLLHSALCSCGDAICIDPMAAVQLLLQLPAAAAVPAAKHYRLIERIIQDCNIDKITQDVLPMLMSTCSLPGPDELVSLITACLKHMTENSAASCIQLLCAAPAAQEISDSAALQLLLGALELQQPLAMHALMRYLPAAAELASKQVQQLLCATVSAALDRHSSLKVMQGTPSLKAAAQAGVAGWIAAVQAVTSLPAVHDADTDTVVHFLTRAVQLGAEGIVQHLLQIATLQQLEQQTVSSLLLPVAVREQQHACMQALLLLHGATDSLDAEQMAQLLQASVQKDDHMMVELLCGMQSVQLLQPQQMSALLATSVKQAKSLAASLVLCKLPAALQLPCAFFMDLVDDVHDAVPGLQASLRKQKTAEFDSVARGLLTYSSASGQYPTKRPLVAPAAPTRVQLGVQLVTALHELQTAVRTQVKLW